MSTNHKEALKYPVHGLLRLYRSKNELSFAESRKNYCIVTKCGTNANDTIPVAVKTLDSV